MKNRKASIEWEKIIIWIIILIFLFFMLFFFGGLRERMLSLINKFFSLFG